MSRRPLFGLAFVLTALIVTGCQQPSQDTDQTASPEQTEAAAGTPSIALPTDHVTTSNYAIDISFPSLPAGEKILAQKLRATADEARKEFLADLPDPEEFPELADRQFQLKLDFELAANTPAFTSVRETGIQDTGGAHPIPVEASFVYDRKGDRMVDLSDLFAQPEAALKALADYSRTILDKKLMALAPSPDEGSPKALQQWKTNTQQMLHEGTQPVADDFAVFVVRAGNPSPGLTLIFPPYHVAAYVYGTQTVKVPASVFAPFLKQQYKDDFAADATE